MVYIHFLQLYVCFQIPEATSIWGLALPHFLLGLGIGIIDSALMPLLANLVDEEGHGEAYGSVYAIAQTAVSLAYGLGPLVGGKLSETIGFAIGKSIFYSTARLRINKAHFM